MELIDAERKVEGIAHIRQRCFFQIKHICCFGTIIKTDHNGQWLLINGDDGKQYKAWASDVVLL